MNYYTHEQIENIMQEEIKNLKKIGIPVDDDICPSIDFPKSNSFYGQACHYSATTQTMKNKFYKMYHKNFNSYLRISEYLLQCPSDKAVRNTIIHELLHTCPKCMNHGTQWQAYGLMVYEAYGYDIKRTGGDKTEWNLSMADTGKTKKVAHQVRCVKCGRTWQRTRHTNLTMYPHRYYCQCGGNIVLDF